MESRHFFDEDRQFTIRIRAEKWAAIQQIANQEAYYQNWLKGEGGDYDNLNLWILRRLSSCPDGVDRNDWVEQAAGEHNE